MEYVEVDSSQIAEVGFGEGFYGPETLGIIFTPNRKQAAAGLPGGEYAYENITPRMHRAMMAADDIYAYFSENIKKHPESFPYVKIETENPPQPPSSPNGGGVTNGMSTTKPSKNSTSPTPQFTATDGVDAETKTDPSTALAVIDTMADDLLFTPGAVTDAQLAAGREWYLTQAKKYDITTEKSRTELKRFARPLQKLRTGIEARAKELTGATKRKIAAIDAEKRRLVMLVGGIEDEVLRPLTEWEKEEERRKIELMNTVTMLADLGTWSYDNISAIEEQISYLESFCVSNMQEYKISAESAVTASLKVLKTELERRKVSEANEAELAKLRAEAAERAENDRLAQVAKDAREHAEKQAAWQAEIDRRKVEDAEQRAKDAEAKAKADAVAAVEAERQRLAEAAARELAESEARAADEHHRNKVNYEAASALVSECLIDEPAAHCVIDAIAKGLIPHITITY